MTGNEETVHLRKYLTGIVGNAPFGIVTLSNDQSVGIINTYAVRLLGFFDLEPRDLVDKPATTVFAKVPELLEAFSKWKTQAPIQPQIFNRLEIDKITVNITIGSLFNGALVIIEDITKTAELEKLLTIRATYDDLTSLPNRREFEERAHRAIAKSVKHTMKGAILFLDLDRFKPINDSAGHAAGDELLRQVAGIFEQSIRGRDIAARIGGDEFAILLEDCEIDKATQIANKIRNQIGDYIFSYEDKSFTIGVSIGICEFGNPGDDLTTTLNSADNACQIAKNQGRNQVHITDTQSDEYSQHKKEVGWIPRIESAISNDEFQLYTQRIIPVQDAGEEIDEILIRLSGHDEGVVLPGAFIPHAERFGLMLDIDRWVLSNSISQAKPGQSYSINLSGQSITHPKLSTFIKRALNESEITTENIILEITESAAIRNFEKALIFIKELKDIGIRFALDDFGAGLSSFTYLKNLPIDFLKIDRSFVENIHQDNSSYSIVSSINEVSHSLHLKSIAEGIEDKESMEALKEIGIDYVQGFLIERPHPMIKK